MKKLTTVGVLVLAAVLAAGCGGSERCSVGNEVIFRAIPPQGQRITSAGMQLARDLLTSRLQTLGPSSPTVAIQDGDELVIQGTNPHYAVAVAKTIGQLADQVQLFDFEASLAPPIVTESRQPAPAPSLYSLLTAAQHEANRGKPQSYYLFEKSAPHSVLRGPAPTLHQLFLHHDDGKQPQKTQVLKLPANREPVSCRGAQNCLGAGRDGTSKYGMYWYLFKLPPALTGKDIVEPDVATTVDPNSGAPIVTLQFTGHGGREFQDISKAEFDRGRSNASRAGQLNPTGPNARNIINQYAGHNAIVLGGQLKSTPYMDYTDSTLSLGIPPGSGAEILEPNAQAAKRAAFVVQSGSLGYRLKLVAQSSCRR